MSGGPDQAAALRRELAAAQRLFNVGFYFEAHDSLEPAWKAAEEPWKSCLQGFIQLAAGFHKATIDPQGREGALYLLQRGLQKLRACRGLVGDDVLSGIERDLKPVLAAIAAGKDFEAPRLKWVKDGGSGR